MCSLSNTDLTALSQSKRSQDSAIQICTTNPALPGRPGLLKVPVREHLQLPEPLLEVELLHQERQERSAAGTGGR